MPQDKIDFKKTLDSYRAKRDEFHLVDVPDMHYLMVDGHGDPNTSAAFGEAIEALYPVSYKLEFASIPGHDLQMTGRHHEIYFSDFRRAAPEKWRTILRQPVVPVG